MVQYHWKTDCENLKIHSLDPKTATQMTRQATTANKHCKGLKWGRKSYSVNSKEGRMGE